MRTGLFLAFTALTSSTAVLAADPSSGSSDWQLDAPGRSHKVDASTLPAPYATPGTANESALVAKPPDAQLRVPDGFQVNVFATHLAQPRTLRVAPNGDVFVAETHGGQIKVLRPTADGTTAATVGVFAQDLNGPFGLQFYPAGPDPHWLYVAENNRVLRFAYRQGDLKAAASPEVVVAQLAPYGKGGHSTRDLVFSADGKRMYVSVGSRSNIAEDMSPRTPAAAQRWEAKSGIAGATWDQEERRADVLEFDLSAANPRGRIFATGLRNCVGLTVQPATGDLWCTVNERDMLGDDLPPDYSTRVKAGGFYGWPWYYIGNHEDPRLRGARPDLAAKVIVPDVLYQAHSAPLNLIFYTATTGTASFPKDYLGDGFAVMHGSWNRATRTGYKVVRVRMTDGVPTGEYDDFLVGFVADSQHVWGRPVAAAVATDGALLVSDDGGGTIYRVAFTH